MKSFVQNLSVIFLVLQSALSGSAQPIEDCATQNLEVQRVQGENTALQAQVASLEAGSAECSDRLSTLQTDAQTQFDLLQNEKDACLAQVASLEAESAECSDRSSTLQAEAQTQFDLLQSEKDGCLSQVATLQGNNVAFRGQLISLQADNTGLQGQIATLQITIAGLHSQIDTLQAHATELQELIAEFTGQHNWVASSHGQSCDSACAAVGGQCNESLMKKVDSADKVRAVYQYVSGRECTTTSTNGVGDEPGSYGTDCVIPERSEDVTCSANKGGWGLARMCCCGRYCPTTI